MKRERVVEIMLECKENIKLNEANRIIQEKLPLPNSAEYLRGSSDTFMIIYNKLSKEY